MRLPKRENIFRRSSLSMRYFRYVKNLSGILTNTIKDCNDITRHVYTDACRCVRRRCIPGNTGSRRILECCNIQHSNRMLPASAYIHQHLNTNGKHTTRLQVGRWTWCKCNDRATAAEGRASSQFPRNASTARRVGFPGKKNWFYCASNPDKSTRSSSGMAYISTHQPRKLHYVG